MNLKVFNAPFAWLVKPDRRYRGPAYLYRDDLGLLPASLDAETIKIAMEQVTKRLDAQLALKTSTETRALMLAGQCMSLLSVVVGAVLVAVFSSHFRWPLLVAGVVAAVCLFLAVREAYDCAAPRQSNVLPGCLPDELWPEIKLPNMKGPEFMGRLMITMQDAMVENERNQEVRAEQLARAIGWVRFSVPLAVLAAGLAWRFGVVVAFCSGLRLF